MSRESSCLILLNGELGAPRDVKIAARGAKAILCCDGGVRHAQTLGLKADFVVGDMDSLPRPLPRWPKAIYWCDFDRDRNDFEKALELACDLGVERAYVAGALGGRLDHAMTNLAVVERYFGVLDATLIGDGRAQLLGPGRHRLDVPRGAKFSLLAAPTAVVSLSGARYECRKTALTRGSRGLSNVSGGRPLLDVSEGRIWLFVP